MSLIGDINQAPARDLRTLFPDVLKPDNFPVCLQTIAEGVSKSRGLNPHGYLNFPEISDDELHRLRRLFATFKTYILNPDKLLAANPRNAEHRKKLAAGTVPGLKLVNIKEHLRTADIVSRFSDDFELDEYLALNYARTFETTGDILLVLQKACPHLARGCNRNQDVYQSNALWGEAIRELYKLERRSTVASLLLLMKLRVHIIDVENVANTYKNVRGYADILSLANELIEGGLRAKLVADLKRRYQRIRDVRVPALAGGEEVSELDILEFAELQDLCLVLYYALYEDSDCFEKFNSQLSLNVLSDLQGLIFDISKGLTNSASLLMAIADSKNSWQGPVHQALVVLQLAHTQCLELITGYAINQPAVPVVHKRTLSTLALNLLRETLAANANSTQCCTAHGTALLGYLDVVYERWEHAPDFSILTIDSVLSQVNRSKSCSGTYDYLRLCVLPVLQARANNSRADHKSRYMMKEDSEFLFDAFVGLLEGLRIFIQNDRDQVFSPVFQDVGNLYAATWAVYPSYAELEDIGFAQITEPDNSFVGKLICEIVETHKSGGRTGINCTVFYLLTSLATDRNAGYVYDLLFDEYAPEDLDNKEGNITRLCWKHILKFVRQCEQNSAKMKPLYENLLVSIFALMQTVFTRCPEKVPSFLDKFSDFAPIGLLFSLVGKPLNIAVKGGIFRALAGIASGPDNPEVCRDIWNEIESYRLLPTYPIGEDLAESKLKAQFELGKIFAVSDKFSHSGLRFELDDVEDKEGVYGITDGFLHLLEILLSHGSNDELGSERRPPGISVYLEFVIEDVLLKAFRRNYLGGPQGDAQKWRLMSRCIRVLSNVLQHYEINSIEEMRAQRESGGEVDDIKLLLSMEDDFGKLDEYGRERRVTYNLETLSFDNQIRRQSAGFMVMTMILANASALRDHLLGLLAECRMAEIERSWTQNYQASTNHALKMGEILGQRFLIPKPVPDSRLDYYGYQGSICDVAYWRARCATATVGLFYECSLREKIFVHNFHVKGEIHMIRIEDGEYIYKPYTVHRLSNLFIDYSPAMCSLIMQLAYSNVHCTSVPSVPVMIANMLKKVSSDLLPTSLLLNVKGQTLVGYGNAPPVDFEDMQRACLHALDDDNNLPLRGSAENNKAVNALGLDSRVDVYSLQENPWKAPNRRSVLVEVQNVLDHYKENVSLLSKFVTVPEAILDYLLVTLEPNCECLAHHLLGFTDYLRHILINRWDIADPLSASALKKQAGYLQNAGDPTTCFERLVKLLEDPGALIQVPHRSILANLCFELLYRICAHPAVSTYVLSSLRANIVYNEQCQRLDENNLLKVCLCNCLTVLSQLPVQMAAHVMRKEVTSCAFVCLGWLLRCIALELRALHLLQTHKKIPVSDATMKPYLWLYTESVTTDEDGVQEEDSHYMYILKRICEEVNHGSLDRFVPNVDPQFADCVAPAITHYYIKRHGVDKEPPEGGPDCYMVVDKHKFNRELRKKILDTDLGDADLNEHADVCIQNNEERILEFNQNCREIAIAEHCIEGWRQCCTVLMACHCKRIVIPPYGVFNDDEFIVYWLQRMVNLVTARGTRLSTKMLEAITLTLRISLEELSKKLYRYAPAGTPFQLVAFPRQNLHIPVQERPIVSLFCGVLRTVCLSVNGFNQPHGATVPLRGYLFSCISSMLTDGFGFPNSINPKYKDRLQGSNNALLCCPDANDSLDEIRSGTAELQSEAVAKLEEYACELADILGRDICTAPVLWRLNACATINNVFVALGKDRIRKPVHVLINRRYLLQMLHIIETFHDDAMSMTGATRHFTSDNRARQELFVSVLTLCTHIAKNPDGAMALVDLQVLQRLTNSPIFRHAPPASGEMGDVAENEVVGHWVTHTLPVLRFLRVLLSTSPSRQVYEGVAGFILANRDSIMYILRLRIKALTGLVLVENLACILMMIASAPLVQQQRDLSGNFDMHYIWDSVFQSFGNTIIEELCDILKKIGKDPLPRDLSHMFEVPGSGAFWGHFSPDSKPFGWVPDETHLKSVNLRNEFTSFPNSLEYNAFKRTKLDLGLKLIGHISALLRLHMHAAIEHAFVHSNATQRSAVLAPTILTVVSVIDLESLVGAFCQSSHISRKCAYYGNVRRPPHPDPELGEYLFPLLQYIANNLITALHDMTIAGCEWQSVWLQAVLAEAKIVAHIPAERAFINELGASIAAKTQI